MIYNFPFCTWTFCVSPLCLVAEALCVCTSDIMIKSCQVIYILNPCQIVWPWEGWGLIYFWSAPNTTSTAAHVLRTEQPLWVKQNKTGFSEQKVWEEFSKKQTENNWRMNSICCPLLCMIVIKVLCTQRNGFWFPLGILRTKVALRVKWTLNKRYTELQTWSGIMWIWHV